MNHVEQLFDGQRLKRLLKSETRCRTRVIRRIESLLQREALGPEFPRVEEKQSEEDADDDRGPNPGAAHAG